MKKLVKTMIQSIAPKYYDAMMTERENRHSQKVMAQHGVPETTTAFVEKHGLQVIAGPFAGMNYLMTATGSALVPKLAGSYEAELHGVLHRILATRYDTVIDVGCAEGYYAVGLAKHLSHTPTVYAYDVNVNAQKLCRELARVNHVEDKINIEGFCDTMVLEQKLVGKSLVVCDCEGYEINLLDPALVPRLAATDILVEIHDTPERPVTTTLQKRFHQSHDILTIAQTDRDPKDYPATAFLPAAQQEVAVNEFRSIPQTWMFLTPKTAA